MERWVQSLLLAIVILVGSPGWVLSASSTNFQIVEDFIGGGGLVESTSSGYNARDVIGPLGVGSSSSTNFRTDSGFVTQDEPRLSFIVTDASVNFGTLSVSQAQADTVSFDVLNYTSYGYTVSITGDPPDNGLGDSLDAMAGGASSPGTEQYGINLVDNATPNIGTNPTQIPDSTFSFGSAASGYGTANNFKYNSGDTIAQAVKESGQTNYTISFIANAAVTTPNGTYTGSHTLVVVGTY